MLRFLRIRPLERRDECGISALLSPKADRNFEIFDGSERSASESNAISLGSINVRNEELVKRKHVSKLLSRVRCCR